MTPTLASRFACDMTAMLCVMQHAQMVAGKVLVYMVDRHDLLDLIKRWQQEVDNVLPDEVEAPSEYDILKLTTGLQTAYLELPAADKEVMLKNAQVFTGSLR